ncbi:hypothetical protein FGO68_gene10160 [Halteria grandinella]|uniref:Uncharacterized protein n=1 Tax=Halteria grandinella TaxID=5974 RepID=A0A8J8NQ86_HALGN|nr:hypothetical protein FGO68_gene10160 [Halteria grandinella]
MCETDSPFYADLCRPRVPTRSLTACKEFAASFNNTCAAESELLTSVDQVQGVELSCKNVLACPTTITDGTNICRFTRKLCVQCYVSQGSTRLRVLSNSFPSHCFNSDTPPSPNNLAFDTFFNPLFYDAQTLILDTLEKLNHQVCTYNVSGYPRGFEKASGVYTNIVGIALTGVPISAGANRQNWDPLFPLFQNVKSTIDACLGDVDETGYHYLANSPCIQSPLLRANESIDMCSSNTLCRFSRITSYMGGQAVKALAPVGVALDGRRIYGVYKGSNSVWGPCDVDVCNGRVINGDYSYVMSNFHPYTVSCWGPGNESVLRQTCSPNARSCQPPLIISP